MNEEECAGEPICLTLVLELADGHRLEFDFNQVQRFYCYRIDCPSNRIAVFGPNRERIGHSVFPTWLGKLRKRSEAANTPPEEG
jgi:hypothetical protein